MTVTLLARMSGRKRRFCCSLPNAISVGPNHEMDALGDARWTAHMIEASFRVAEGSQATMADFETGASGGGFDALEFSKVIPAFEEMAPTDVDLSLPLNRRGEGKQRELVLRSALGAGRLRLLGGRLTECGLVALTGGLAGLGLAVGAVVRTGEGPRVDDQGFTALAADEEGG